MISQASLLAQEGAAQESAPLLAKGPVVIDLLGRLEWMRCSIGQVWVEDRCDGQVLTVPLAATSAIVARAEASSGTGWRLPERKELQRLIDMQDQPPMIDTKRFPQTHAGGYWTADANRVLRNNHWIVNFYTGHSYGRARPRQAYAVRLVRDR